MNSSSSSHGQRVAARALSFQNRDNPLSKVRSGGPKNNISQIAGPSSTSTNSNSPVISKQLTTVLTTALDVLKDATPKNETFTSESIYGDKSSDEFVGKNPLSKSEQFSIGLDPKIGSELSVNAEEITVSDSKTSQELNRLKTIILDKIDMNKNLTPQEKEIVKTKIENETNTLIKQSLQERCSVYNTVMSIVDADIDKRVKMDFKETVLSSFFDVSDEKVSQAQAKLTQFSQSNTVSDSDFLKQNDAMNNMKEAKGTIKRMIGSKPFTYTQTILKLGKAIRREIEKLFKQETHNIKKSAHNIKKSIETYSQYSSTSTTNDSVLQKHTRSLGMKMQETSKVVAILKDVVSIQSGSKAEPIEELKKLNSKVSETMKNLTLEMKDLQNQKETGEDFSSEFRNKTRTFQVLSDFQEKLGEIQTGLSNVNNSGEDFTQSLDNGLHYLNDKLQKFSSERYDEINKSQLKALELDQLVTLLDEGKSGQALISTGADIALSSADIASSGLKFAAYGASIAAAADGGTTAATLHTASIGLHAAGHSLKGAVSVTYAAKNIIQLKFNAKTGDKMYENLAHELSQTCESGNLDSISSLINQMEITRTGVIESSKDEQANLASLIYGVSASAYALA